MRLGLMHADLMAQTMTRQLAAVKFHGELMTETAL